MLIANSAAPDRRRILPALVAQLDAHPTGDLEVANSTPAGSAIFLRGD